MAVFRGGYIGPDYPMHLSRLIEWPKVFDFSATNPPIYYLLGHALFLLIGPTNSFPITLSIIQVAVNLFALWYFFLFTQPRFRSGLIHSGLCLLLIFLPVRMVHAAVIGTDSLTVPLFVLLLFLVDKLLLDDTSTSRNATLLGLGLGIAVWVKYSFMALIPALFAFVVWLWAKRRWKWQRLIATGFLSLAFPSALSLHSFWASSQEHGYNTEKHWRQKGIPPDMTYKDLFFVKADDIQLFQAPEYFKREILSPHKYSYLALSHMAVFTDPLNLFQDLSVRQDIGSVLIPDQKTRRPWKTRIMSASMSLGTIWTVSALLGTIWLVFSSLKQAFTDRIERENVTILLGLAYFLLMFLPIPFVHGGALFGYWTPRLILPALLTFFLAAFLFIDRKVAPRSRKLAILVLGLVVVQDAIEIVMLS